MLKRCFWIGCVSLALSISLVQCDLVDGRAEWDVIECYNTDGNARTCKSCVTVYDENSIYTKGCYEELSTAELAQCASGTSLVKCLQCKEKLCNRGHPTHKCVECDASQDARCANEAQSLSAVQCGNTASRLTSFYCYVRSNAGVLQRGCLTTLSDVNTCERSGYTVCDYCETSGQQPCNTFAFPRPPSPAPTEAPSTDNPGQGTTSATPVTDKPAPADASSNWIMITITVITLVLVIAILGYLVYTRKRAANS